MQEVLANKSTAADARRDIHGRLSTGSLGFVTNFISFRSLMVEVEEHILKSRSASDAGVILEHIPCLEWVRLQFSPSNPYTRRALQFTCRFDLCSTLQSRNLRHEHPWSHYSNALVAYWRFHALRHNDHQVAMSVDDKASGQVGCPGSPMAFLARSRRSYAGPVHSINALDHDFATATKLEPSIVLVCNVVEGESMVQGQIYMCLKNKIFEPSESFRHFEETARIFNLHLLSLPSHVASMKTMLSLLSDGGGDRNITHRSVQLSYLALFLSLDLDRLLIQRTAPYQSFMNPVERCMSIINLSLQNCAFSRLQGDPDMEAFMKQHPTMSTVREGIARLPVRPGLQMIQKIRNSVQPVMTEMEARVSQAVWSDRNVVCIQPATPVQSAQAMNLTIIINRYLT